MNTATATAAAAAAAESCTKPNHAIDKPPAAGTSGSRGLAVSRPQGGAEAGNVPLHLERDMQNRQKGRGKYGHYFGISQCCCSVSRQRKSGGCNDVPKYCENIETKVRRVYTETVKRIRITERTQQSGSTPRPGAATNLRYPDKTAHATQYTACVRHGEGENNGVCKTGGRHY